MVLILISWIYLFFTSLTLGIVVAKLIKIKSVDVVTTSFFGLYFTTLLASVWSIFGAINGNFHLALLLLNILFFIRYKKTFQEIITTARQHFNDFSKTIKILFVAFYILVLAHCADTPFIIDNDSYYIQSIKWLNEYGLVKGLANLHLFLGQMSGWHITQSVFTFSFLYDRFNDLNGFALLLLNFFAFKKLNAYFRNGNRTDLLFGLLPIANLFFFAFTSSPSPDLPVYILSFLVFAIYIEEKSNPEAFSIIMLLVLFAIFIKVTAVVLLIFPIILLVKRFTVAQKNILPIGFLAATTLGLLIAKNVILTGYPLFPLSFLRCDRLDYTLPTTIHDYFFSAPMMHSFYMPITIFENASVSDCLQNYFLHNGLDSIIGILTIIMVLITPLILLKFESPKNIKNIYFAFLVLLLLLGFSSPQYRFFVHFTLFFGLFVSTFLLRNKNIIIGLIAINLILIATFLFIPLPISGVAETNTLQIENIIFPKPNSKFKSTYAKATKGNLTYYTPMEFPYFWITGNGNLPCVTTDQLNYFETNFEYIPQRRGAGLKDGFYAKKVAHD